MHINSNAGKPVIETQLVDVPKLVSAYYTDCPDASVPAQRIIFGTSGHRGSSLQRTFNEWHILAISQAICLYRHQQGITGPLFLGMDTHALSLPAMRSAVEVLAANGVTVMLAQGDEFTPTPVISHAILTYNHGRTTDLADGIVVTPSHNPPHDGGFKYNPPHGGPAESGITRWIGTQANAFLAAGLRGVLRITYEQALRAPTTHRHDYRSAYIRDLGQVVDMAAISEAGITLGVDALGGAGVHYWRPIAEQYGLQMTIVDDLVDPTFRFMTADWDGQIRMDPSSPYAMQRLIGMRDRFDVAVACDTDYDRHGIVTRSAGLLPSNHYLAVMVAYLFQPRPDWSPDLAIGKSVVTTRLIDRIAHKFGRRLFEVPVGFKWFAAGLHDGSLGFAGEESAGASFARRDGAVWTTDKDGIIAALLAAEITVRKNRDPGELYRDLASEFGDPVFGRLEAAATTAQLTGLAALSVEQVTQTELAGDPIRRVLTVAPGNQAPIGGVQVITDHGWFTARPSGTEPIYRIYAESFRDPTHLKRIQDEAQTLVDRVLEKKS